MTSVDRSYSRNRNDEVISLMEQPTLAKISPSVAGEGQLRDITVCICSYRRPALLRRTLQGLSQQETRGLFEYSVVVCDNDPGATAKSAVTDLSGQFARPVVYCSEPRTGIAYGRNAALKHATGDTVAFIDDDEVPDRDWLCNLYSTLSGRRVAGVLGPVRPLFDMEPPKWLRKSGCCERPEHATGFVMPWGECRTGNLLFRREIIDDMDPVFDPNFVTGSDTNFFVQMAKRGHKFVWCNEAVVHEVVSPARWTRRFYVRRALLRGAYNMRQPRGRAKGVLKAIVALPVYTVMLPLLQLFGHHIFMKYFIKWCNHMGRLLACFGIVLVKQRDV